MKLMLGEKKFIRQQIIEALFLFSDQEALVVYQRAAPECNLTQELLDRWDEWYSSSYEQVRVAFSQDEIRLLMDFDDELSEVIDEMPLKIKFPKDFIETKQAVNLAEIASKALDKLLRS